MPLIHGWHSRYRELHAPDHDLIGLVIPHLLFHVGEHLKELVFE